MRAIIVPLFLVLLSVQAVDASALGRVGAADGLETRALALVA
jgi:hypothetical protein